MNYLINDIEGLEEELDSIRSDISNIKTDIALLKDKIQTNSDNIQINKDNIAINTNDIKTNKDNIDELEKNKVEKREGYDIVKVEDVETGDINSVPSIGTLRDWINQLHSHIRIIGGTTNTNAILNCLLKPTPLTLVSFSLNKGTYLITASIRHKGTDSTGVIWIEAKGKRYYETPISNIATTAIIGVLTIDSDNTTIEIKGVRKSGLDLAVVNSSEYKSYANWIEITNV